MMKTTVLLPLITLALLLVGAGCTDQQLTQADAAVQDATAAVQGVAGIAHGPAAALLPPQVLRIMELLGVGASVALAIWKWLLASGLLRRNQDLTVTLKAIVDGVEKAGNKADPVKTQILEIMRDREIYSRANPIVDQVKSQPEKIS